jgi:hypothetical protein
LQADQLLRKRWYPIAVTARPTKVHPHVAAIGPTQVRKRLSERRDVSLRQGIVFWLLAYPRLLTRQGRCEPSGLALLLELLEREIAIEPDFSRVHDTAEAKYGMIEGVM